MLVHHKVLPNIKFAGTHLYTWVERGTARIKCLAQEHNTMSLGRAPTWTQAQSGDKCTNMRPPHLNCVPLSHVRAGFSRVL